MYNDFIVRYDPKKESINDLSKKILINAFVTRRLKENKPVKIGIFGKSGEGKSISTLKLEQILLPEGVSLIDVMDTINVYVPIEYPQKIDKILGLNKGGFKETNLKNINIIAVHEARELVKSKDWQSFISTTISDVNELSRQIKPLVFLIVSQNIKDITLDVRSTLDFYIKTYRPFKKKARLYVNVMWSDDRDMEKVKLRKRRMTGCIIYPNGMHRRYSPKYIEVSKPSKDVISKFDSQDFEAKSRILKNKLNKLLSEMKESMNIESDKVINIANFYLEKTEVLNTVGKIKNKKWKLNKEIQKIHELSDKEYKELEYKIQSSLAEKANEIK